MWGLFSFLQRGRPIIQQVQKNKAEPPHRRRNCNFLGKLVEFANRPKEKNAESFFFGRFVIWEDAHLHMTESILDSDLTSFNSELTALEKRKNTIIPKNNIINKRKKYFLIFFRNLLLEL